MSNIKKMEKKMNEKIKKKIYLLYKIIKFLLNNKNRNFYFLYKFKLF